jgi:hypothetical protein
VLIALLAVLGVDVIVIVILLAVLLIRRRWVSHQMGAFKGAIRITEGDVPGLKKKWKRGYGRWVSNVLVWTKGPFLFRNELVVAEGLLDEVRAARPGEVKRLGKHLVIVPVAVEGGSRLEAAISESSQSLMRGPISDDVPRTDSQKA